MRSMPVTKNSVLYNLFVIMEPILIIVGTQTIIRQRFQQITDTFKKDIQVIMALRYFIV